MPRKMSIRCIDDSMYRIEFSIGKFSEIFLITDRAGVDAELYFG